MTKKNIKYGTIGTIAFCLVAFIVITLLSKPSASDDEDRIEHQEARWLDTLTNNASGSAQLAGMDAEITRFLDKWRIPGITFAISRNDSLVYARGYGMADAEKGVEMQPNHIMRLASASKLITAVAIVRLVEKGKLKFDSKVFGPDGIIKDPSIVDSIYDKRLFDVTVDDLLRHQGGFGRSMGDPMFTTKDIIRSKNLSAPPTARELASIVVGRRLSYTPGSGHRYSNFGYLLLSLIIEEVSGKDYWTYVQEDVLNPAGCYGFRPATNYYDQRYANEVKYYAPDNEQIEEYTNSGRIVDRCYGGSDVRGLMGAGGWCASAADYCRFVAAIDGDPAVPDIISKKHVDLMTAFSKDEKRAFGWTSSDEAGKWTRTGTLSSTSAFIRRFPDGECWVFITNSGVWTGFHFSNDIARLIDRLRDKYSSRLPAKNLFPN